MKLPWFFRRYFWLVFVLLIALPLALSPFIIIVDYHYQLRTVYFLQRLYMMFSALLLLLFIIAFRKLYQDIGYDRSFLRGWFWDAELLIRAQKKGFTVREAPVTWSAADQSSFCVVHEMRMIPCVARFWLKTVLA